MDEDLLGIILKYNRLVKNITQSNRQIVLKDKTMLQYLAYCLSSKEAATEIVEPALETLQLLSNDNNISQLVETYGVVKAVNLTASREDLPDDVKSKAVQLHKKLDAPAYSTRSKTRDQALTDADMTQKVKSSKLINFHIHGMNKEKRSKLENVLVKVKGVISLVLDLDHQRCTVRVVQSVSATDLASTIHQETNMEASLVCKNSYGQEILKPLLDNQCDESEEDLPPYPDDIDSPVKDNAVVKRFDIKEKTSYLFNCASEFLKNSFYW